MEQKLISLGTLQKKIVFTFSDPTLLLEALTHISCSEVGNTVGIGNGMVKFRRKHNHRLQVLGSSILQLIVRHYACCTFNTLRRKGFTDEQVLKCIEEFLYSEQIFQAVGKDLALMDYIDAGESYALKLEDLYKDVVEAIFAGVLIDCHRNRKCGRYLFVLKLFEVLWRPFCGLAGTMIVPTITSQFQPSHVQASGGKSLQRENAAVLEARLSYRFQNDNFLMQALSYKNCDPPSSWLLLRFLGEKVFQFAVCHYLYWYYPNDANGSVFNSEKVVSCCDANVKQMCAKHLNMEEYLRIKRVSEGLSDASDDSPECYIETLMGAAYIDKESVVEKVKIVVIGLIAKAQPPQGPTSPLRPLPFNFRTYYGSHYHLLKKYQRRLSSITTETHPSLLPPDAQEAPEIVDVTQFETVWAPFYGDKVGSFKANLLEAFQDEMKDSLVRNQYSVAYCNEMEFNRIGIFRVAARMQLMPYIECTTILRNNYCYGELHEFLQKSIGEQLKDALTSGFPCWEK